MNHLLSNKRKDSRTTRQTDIFTRRHDYSLTFSLTQSNGPIRSLLLSLMMTMSNYCNLSDLGPFLCAGGLALTEDDSNDTRYSASSSRRSPATNNGSSVWERGWSMRSHSSYGSHSAGHRYYPDQLPSISTIVIWCVSIALGHHLSCYLHRPVR